MRRSDDKAEILEVLLNTPLGPSGSRKPQSRQDFGDLCTIRLSLRRIPFIFATADLDADFGVYLGKHGSEFVVGIKDLMWNIVSLECYESLEKLKQNFELD